MDQFKVKVGVGLEENNFSNLVLLYASPSPFTDELTITYEISVKSDVRLDIYNYSGQHISTLVDNIKQQGTYKLRYNGKELPAGVYFCVLKTKNGIQTTKMIKL